MLYLFRGQANEFRIRSQRSVTREFIDKILVERTSQLCTREEQVCTLLPFFVPQENNEGPLLFSKFSKSWNNKGQEENNDVQKGTNLFRERDVQSARILSNRSCLGSIKWKKEQNIRVHWSSLIGQSSLYCMRFVSDHLKIAPSWSYAARHLMIRWNQPFLKG